MDFKTIVLVVGFTLYAESFFAQEFLGKTGDEIRAHIVRLKNIECEAKSTDSLYMECREEDKRGERYVVAYSFLLKYDRCVAYYRTVPCNRDWLDWLNDMIEMQEGESSGEEQVAGDYTFFTVYRFEDFSMRLSVKKEKITMKFEELESGKQIRIN